MGGIIKLGMLDIHCHVLPNVDDGPESLDESLRMVDLFIDAGYRGAITTSHFHRGRYVVNRGEVDNGLETLREALYVRSINFPLYPGNEINLDEMTLTDLRACRLYSLNGSRYLLIEFPFRQRPIFARELIYNLQLEGYTPIIAHPERYIYVQENPLFLLDFLELGCLAQMNIPSITNKGVVGATARKLLENDWIQILGTDAHNAVARSPKVKNDLGVIEDLVGTERLKEMTETRPQMILENEIINYSYGNFEKEISRSKKKWYQFWK